jgi:hypothetical protein
MSRVSESETMGRQFERLLGSMEAAKRPNPLFGADAKTAEQVVKGIVDPILCGSGMTLVGLNQYRWFARELSRILRSDGDRILAMHLAMLIQKWQGFGLEKNTLQLLVCEVFEKLVKLQEHERERLVPGPDGAAPDSDITTKTPRHEGVGPPAVDSHQGTEA